jgi:hypothetical protein
MATVSVYVLLMSCCWSPTVLSIRCWKSRCWQRSNVSNATECYLFYSRLLRETREDVSDTLDATAKPPDGNGSTANQDRIEIAQVTRSRCIPQNRMTAARDSTSQLAVERGLLSVFAVVCVCVSSGIGSSFPFVSYVFPVSLSSISDC